MPAPSRTHRSATDHAALPRAAGSRAIHWAVPIASPALAQTALGQTASAQTVSAQTAPPQTGVASENGIDGQAGTGEPANSPPTDPNGFDPAALGGSNTLAGLLMAGGVLIITFILMSRLRNKQRSAPSELTTKEQIAQIRARAADSRGIDAFKADAHDFTRQMAALLDSKAERLEQLIADADERLARLARLSRLAHLEGRAERDPDDRHAIDGHAQYDDAPGHDDEDGYDQPARPTRARSDQPDRPDRPPASRRVPPDLDGPVSVDPLHDRVYRLADSGLDPVAIARETGQPTGQIELILALRG